MQIISISSISMNEHDLSSLLKNHETEHRLTEKSDSKIPSVDHSTDTNDTQHSDGSNSPNRSRCVSFSTCEIHSFKMVLGDNPGVQIGLPIQLGPESDETNIIDIDTYEDCRDGKRKKGKDLSISFYERLRLLRMSGYSDDELARRLDEVEKTKKNRERSSRGFSLRKRIGNLIHRH